MPIYKNNGVTYNIPDDKAAGFEAKFPGAMVALENEGVKYELPVSKKKGFMEKFPGATYAAAGAPVAPRAEDVKPVVPETQRTVWGEESIATAKLPEVKPIKVHLTERQLKELREMPEPERNEALEGGSFLTDEHKTAREEFDAKLSPINKMSMLDGSVSHFNAPNIPKEFKYDYDFKKEFGYFPGGSDTEFWNFLKTKTGEDYQMKMFGRPLSDYEIAKLSEDARRLGFWGSVGQNFKGLGYGLKGVELELAEGIADIFGVEHAQENINKERERILTAQDNFKPTAEGFGGFVAEMIPQMVGTGAGILVSTVNPALGGALITGSTAAQVASSMGSEALEARRYGASDGQVALAMLMNGAVELATEKYVNSKYLKRVMPRASRVVAEASEEAVSREFDSLLDAARKELGGKFTAKTANEFIKDVLEEGGSEFAAEALQTLVPMIYQHPEDYPTLVQVFENGWEGAKGGFFMGGILGGASTAVQRRANNKRRAAQGFVDVANITVKDENGGEQNAVVEILGKDENGKLVALMDNEQVIVDESDIKDRAVYDYDFFASNEVAFVREEGYNATDDVAPEIKRDYDMERERAVQTLGEDVVAALDNDPVGTLAGMNEVDRVEAMDYVNARVRYEGMIDRISDDIDERIKASDKEIDSHANKADGMIHPATMRGVNGGAPRKVYIVSGNVATREDGTIDKANSSSMIIVRDAETGEVSAASADDLESLEAVIDTATEKKSVAEQIANEYAGQKAAVIESGSATSDDNVPPVEENAPVVEQTQPVAQTALERVPKAENGEPVYEQADADTAWDAIMEQTNDEELATQVVEGMIADKEAALKKLENSKVREGVTVAEKIAAAQQRKAAIEKAKADLAKWQEIAAVKANRAENANVEQTAPVESAPVEEETDESTISPTSDQVGDQVTEGGIPDQSGVPVNEEVGPFGRIYRQFKGKAKEAIQFLLGKKQGEAVGALSHPEIGDIDLVWGEEGTSNSDGYGLAKLAKYHPEVLDNLQEIINDMRVTKRSANRVQLESDTHQAAVRLTWDNKSKNWLLTAFEKKNSVSDNTTDTGETSIGGKQNDTATLQNTVSTDEGTTQSAKVQENSQKSGEDELDVYLAEMKAAQERQKAFAQKSPRPSSFVEAYTANDAEVIKRLDKQFNDALQTLVPLDIPAIEATIRGMKDRKSTIKAGSANGRKETPAYKAFDRIEKALAKRKKQLEKELTEDDKRRIDIIKRGNRGELKETTQPKQEKASQGERSKGKTESESKPEVEKIEDVGEKIGGAKKDRFAEGMARIKAELEETDETLMDKLAKLPVSQVFNFDLEKLREGGISNEAISFIKIVKDYLPAKPRKTYKIRSWVNNTLALYKLCLEAGTNWDRVNTLLNGPQFTSSSLKEQFDAYMAIGGFDSGMNIGNAKLKQLDNTSGGYDESGKFVTLAGKWYVRDAGKHGGIYDTKEEAVNALKAFAGDKAGVTSSGKKREVKFGVYQRRQDKSIFIAVKGKSDIVIQDGFKSSKEAFDYIEANNAELQERYRALLDKTNADFEDNRPREGRDYRDGKDIPAEEFRTTFGFRGVEFGNWMTQEDRRKALNECYDALMDLAAVCKVSPRALSLGGTLGMAFGARGGGRFSAHYEPGKLVINLTKTKGAGSLAHEWFHALDNYFAKMGSEGLDVYATAGEGLFPEGISSIGKRYYDRKSGQMLTEEEYNERMNSHEVRREMADAWKSLMETLKKSDYYKRSAAYAGLHNSKYWARPTELGARAFSTWVENELSKQGASNDYLANNPRFLVSEATDEQSRFMPYPFDADATWMEEAFGNLFEVMQEKTTEDGKAVLYSIAEDAMLQDRGTEAFERATKVTMDAVERLKANGLDIEVVSQEEANEMNTNRVSPLRTVGGKVYGWAVDGKIRITPDGINPNTPVHEYAHLWGADVEKTNPKLWNKVVEAMKLSPVWNEVANDANYSDIHGNDSRMASEVLARLSGGENYRRTMKQAEKEIANANGVFEKAERISSWAKVKAALKSFWDWVQRNVFHTEPMDWQDFVDDVVGRYYGVSKVQRLQEKIGSLARDVLNAVFKQSGIDINLAEAVEVEQVAVAETESGEVEAENTSAGEATAENDTHESGKRKAESDTPSVAEHTPQSLRDSSPILGERTEASQAPAQRNRNMDREAWKKVFKKGGEKAYDLMYELHGGIVSRFPQEFLAYLKGAVGVPSDVANVVEVAHNYLVHDFKNKNPELFEIEDAPAVSDVHSLLATKGYSMLEHTMDNGKAIGVKMMYRDKFVPSGQTDTSYTPEGQHGRSVICYYSDPDSRLHQQYVFTVTKNNATETPTAYELAADPSLMTTEWAEYLEKVDRKNEDGTYNLEGLQPDFSDPFSLSHLMIRIGKTSGDVEIISRYNHGAFDANGVYQQIAGQPNATLDGNLNKLASGLYGALADYKNIKPQDVMLAEGVKIADDGKVYRFTRMAGDIYVGDGFWIKDNEAHVVDRNKERMVGDLVVGKDYVYDIRKNIKIPVRKAAVIDGGIEFYTGGEAVIEVREIEVNGEKRKVEKTTWKGGEKTTLKDNVLTTEITDGELLTNIARMARPEEIVATDIKEVGDGFLDRLAPLERVEMPNLERVGDDAFSRTRVILYSFPKLREVGDGFMPGCTSYFGIEFPSLEKVGDEFMSSAGTFSIANAVVTLPKLREVGDGFLQGLSVRSVVFKSLEVAGDGFLQNAVVKTIGTPELRQVGENFLSENANKVEVMSAPKLENVPADFMAGNAAVRESIEEQRQAYLEEQQESEQTMFRRVAYDEAVQIVSDFNKTFKGAAKRVVISKGKDALEQQMREAGFIEESIEAAMEVYAGENIPTAGHLWKSDGIVVFRFDSAEKLYEALWHENTHRALRKIYGNNRTLAQTRFNELPEHIKQEYVDFLKAAGSKVSEYAEEALCYFVGSLPRRYGYLKNGRYDITTFFRVGDNAFKRFVNFAQNLIDYTVYHGEETEHRGLYDRIGEVVESRTEGGNSVHQRNSEVERDRTEATGGLTESEIALLEASTGYTREEIIDMFGYELNREGAGPLTDREVVMESDPYSKVLGKPRYYGKRQREFVARQRRRMADKARQVAEKLNLDNVEVLESTEGLTGKKATSKGWFDPRTGKITVVVPNHGSTGDIVETVLHEAVAHYGLRKLFGENFKNFLDNVYRNVTPEIRAEINELAKKHDWDFHTATEEYLASLAENTNFERVNPSVWSNIKSFFMKMLAKVGITLDEPLGDNELRYILWRSHQNLVNPGWFNVFGQAEDIAKQYELGVGNYQGESGERRAESGDVAAEDDSALLHREGQEEETARERYERRVKTGMYQAQEALQDSMLGLKEAMMSILGPDFDGYIEDVPEFENAYIAENALSSINKAEVDAMANSKFKPLYDAVTKLALNEEQKQELIDYMFAKHGLERNEVMALRDAVAHVENLKKGIKNLLNKKTLTDEQRTDLERAIALIDAQLNGVVNSLPPAEAQKWYDGKKYSLDKQLQEGSITQQVYNRKLKELGIIYNEGFVGLNRRTDYAGLTALTEEADVVKAEAEARKMVEEYEAAHDTADLWEKVKAVNDAILRKQFECGLMSKETYDKISSMYQYYIPLRGFAEETSADAYAYLNDSKSGFSAPIKTARGRKSKADDPFANLEAMAESGIMQGNRNRLVKQRFLNFVMRHRSDLASVSELWLKYNEVKNEWEVALPDNIEDTDSPEDVERKVAEFEKRMEELAEANPELYKRGKDAENIPYRVVQDAQKQQHQVIVKRAGKPYVITINGNPRAAQAINGQTNPDNDLTGAIGAVFKQMERLNRFLSDAYTTKNPDFMVSNFWRDTLFSNIMTWIKESPVYAWKFNRNFLKVNPKKMKSLYKKYREGTLDMNNEIERMFKDFIMNGGETGYSNLRDMEQRKKDVEKAIAKAAKGGEVTDALVVAFEEMSKAIENCSRFAAFMTSRQLGRNMARSVYDAKEVSVNFNKKGAGAKFMGKEGQTFIGNSAALISGTGRAFYVFWNAAIQGTTNFGRQFKRHPVKTVGTAFAMFVLGAIMAALGDDDEDDKNAYYNLPEYVRRSNILFRVGDSWVSIPLPVEFRALYGAGELMASVLGGKQHYTTGELAEQVMGIVSQVLPLDIVGDGGLKALIPSAARPLIDAYGSNESWTGLPIYRDNDFNKDDPEWTKAYSGANRYLVGLAEKLNEWTGGDKYTKGAININPARVEYLLEQYFGGYTSTVDKLVKTTEMMFGEREYSPNFIPLWNRMVKAGDERTEFRAVTNEYYRLKDEYKATKGRLNGYEKEADLGALEYAEKLDFLNNSPEYVRYEIFETYRRDIEDLEEEIKELKEEKADEKEIKEVETELTLLRKEMIEEMKRTYK